MLCQQWKQLCMAHKWWKVVTVSVENFANITLQHNLFLVDYKSFEAVYSCRIFLFLNEYAMSFWLNVDEFLGPRQLLKGTLNRWFHLFPIKCTGLYICFCILLALVLAYKFNEALVRLPYVHIYWESTDVYLDTKKGSKLHLKLPFYQAFPL